ncbi:MAG: hypothetical protein EOS39_08595 [Mesorhizobium sp.]|nr:MAG: hypothetical protein EOS39_08595 [Mesorhizobium sp.]TIV55446.1 MAG: hypothetical protein E5V88_01750 [Mesorhizobium sp.]
MVLRSCRSAWWALRYPDFHRLVWIVGEGVRLVSITHEMGEHPKHVMMRQIMPQFDEYRSKENAKQVLLISAYAGTTREVAARCRYGPMDARTVQHTKLARFFRSLLYWLRTRLPPKARRLSQR